MAQILAYPFRILPGGIVDLVDQDSDVGHGQQVAVIVATRRGERPLVPTFGIDDPTFTANVSLNDVAASVELFGPPVTIVDVTAGPIRRSRVEVEVTFQ